MKSFRVFFVCLLALCPLFTGCAQSAGLIPSNTEPAEAVLLEAQTVEIPVSVFVDVTADAWYAAAVGYVMERGLIDAADGVFSPDAPANRGVIAEALWRAAGKPPASRHAGFTDLDETDTAAIDWAAEVGVVNGYSDGRFGAARPVTREQFAAMLWRMAGKPNSGSIPDFADASLIAPYAVDAAAWVRENGMILGKPGNLFDPQSILTRYLDPGGGGSHLVALSDGRTGQHKHGYGLQGYAFYQSGGNRSGEERLHGPAREYSRDSG